MTLLYAIRDIKLTNGDLIDIDSQGLLRQWRLWNEARCVIEILGEGHKSGPTMAEVSNISKLKSYILDITC